MVTKAFLIVKDIVFVVVFFSFEDAMVFTNYLLDPPQIFKYDLFIHTLWHNKQRISYILAFKEVSALGLQFGLKYSTFANIIIFQ